jgi:ribosomal-protein-alanine N-acetyltransferase
MTAVVQHLCQFAFQEFGLVKITGHVFATNPGSTRVLQKCGFEQEGYLKKHYLKDGRYLDAWLYARLRAAGCRAFARPRPWPPEGGPRHPCPRSR